MSEWKLYKIRELGEVVGGGTPSTKENLYWNGMIPWLTPKDLTSYSKTTIGVGERSITDQGLRNSSAKLLPKGSILITSRAPIGYVAISSNEISTNQGFKSVVPNEKLHNFYLYYWVKNNVDFLNQLGSGTTFAEISGSVLKEIEVLLPPIQEQQAIAEVLSSLDDKIDLLHRQNQTLEQMAETLFRKWFIKSPEDKVSYSENFKLGTFSEWILETVGGEWGKDEFDEINSKTAFCIRGTDIADLNTGLPLKIPLRFIKESKFQKIEPQEGDIILEISGGTESQSTGRVTYINEDIKALFDYPLVFSNFCRMLRVSKPEYSYFVYCYIQYLYHQDEFFNLENGSSGIKNLDYKALIFDMEYLMPEESLVIKFHKTVEKWFKKVNQNKKQIITLMHLRDTLLPKLISAEVRVKVN